MSPLFTLLFVPVLPHTLNLVAIGFYLTAAGLGLVAYLEAKS